MKQGLKQVHLLHGRYFIEGVSRMGGGQMIGFGGKVVEDHVAFLSV